MKRPVSFAAVVLAAAFMLPAFAAGAKPKTSPSATQTKPQQSVTYSSVTIGGKRIAYKAVAGTLILKNKKHKPAASIFYVAYFKRGVKNYATRPITFFYNGGPGSSSVWLHMGAFGPQRIVTTPAPNHTPAAPYRLVNNDYSLLNVTDEVFIDAPATGYSRILPDGKAKNFFGIDQDGRAFSNFIVQFLSRYNRWNSPKYLFGESYGTTRNSVLSWDLENNKNVSLNGVIMLSTIMSFDTSIDAPGMNPGINLPYELALPTYAATSWYHHRLPNETQKMALKTLLRTVEEFAMNSYAHALNAGNTISSAEKNTMAAKLHLYTGLSTSYLLRADLRVSGPEYEHELLNNNGETTGRLDTRFIGPSMNPLAREAYYDPQSSSISQAYVAGFNWYTRNVLKFGKGQYYRPVYYGHMQWSFKNRPPFSGRQVTPNVMLNLAAAMKYNPGLKVMVNGGYFDLATPFYAAWYQFEQLPITKRLEKNISFYWYASGHMVYVHVPALKKLHANVTRFIEQTDHAH